jgi:hypothetical protein
MPRLSLAGTVALFGCCAVAVLAGRGFGRLVRDEPSPSGRASTPPVDAPAAALAKLGTITLVYRGVHEGDHPPVRYEATATVSAGRRDEANVRIYESSWLVDGMAKPNYFIEASVAVDDLRPVTQHLRVVPPFPAFADELRFGREDASARFTTGERSASGVLSEQVAGGVYTLDLLLASRKLGPDFRERLVLADRPASRDRLVRREFLIRVAGREDVTVVGKPTPCWIVEIEPQDGEQRFRSTWHIPVEGPPFAVKKRYVFNPVTDTWGRQSSGTEELISVKTQ